MNFSIVLSNRIDCKTHKDLFYEDLHYIPEAKIFFCYRIVLSINRSFGALSILRDEKGVKGVNASS